MHRFYIGLLAVVLASFSFTDMVRGADDGQDDLDQATDLKLTVRNSRDLDKVCELCESAIEKGLDEESLLFAQELWASTLFEYASRLAAPVFEQQPPDPHWQFMRTQALPRLEKAVELKPEWAEAYFMMARWQSMDNGDPEKARDAIKLAVENIESAPVNTHAEIYLWRGNLADDDEQRLEYFNKSLETDPEYMDALRVRAFFFALKGETEGAATDFRKLMELDEQNGAYQRALIETYTTGEMYDEALAEIGKIIEADPESTEGYLMRARLQLVREDSEAALEDLNKVLEIDDRDPLALLLRSRVYLDMERNDEARADVDRLMEISPDMIDAILTRSMVATAEEDYEAAIEDMELLVRARPQNLAWQLQLAMLYYVDERPTKSIESYSRVLAADPENFFALRGRGDAFLGMGKHTDAFEDYERALEVDSEDSALLNNFAWLLATSPTDELRDGERSVELATKSCQITDYGRAHILSTLASGYAEIGDFENAKEWAAKAVEMAEDDEQRENLQKEYDSYVEGKPWRERQEEKDRIPPRRRTDL